MSVNMVPCHHGMARPQVADGGDSFQAWKIAVKVLNKQLRTAEKGRSFSLIVGRYTGLQTYTDCLERPKQRNSDMRFVKDIRWGVRTGFIWLNIRTSGGLL
jgi:hypothetical protein